MVVAGLAIVAQSTPMPVSPDTLPQLGVAGAFVAFLAWLVKYFISVIEKKDERIKELTENHNNRVEAMAGRFVSATEKQTQAIVEFSDQLDEMKGTQQDMARAVSELGGALRRSPRE